MINIKRRRQHNAKDYFTRSFSEFAYCEFADTRYFPISRGLHISSWRKTFRLIKNKKLWDEYSIKPSGGSFQTWESFRWLVLRNYRIPCSANRLICRLIFPRGDRDIKNKWSFYGGVGSATEKLRKRHLSFHFSFFREFADLSRI